MSGIFLFSIAMFLGYFALKYSACRAFFSKRPTFKEVWAYSFENDKKRGRNARAFKYFAIFLVFFGVLAVIASPPNHSLATELKDRSYVIILLKMTLLIVVGMNIMVRHVIYEEEHKGGKKFAIPLLEIFDVFKKTGWFVRGKDLVSITINFTSVGILFISIVLFYIK